LEVEEDEAEAEADSYLASLPQEIDSTLPSISGNVNNEAVRDSAENFG